MSTYQSTERAVTHDRSAARLPWFWYRIGNAHLRSIRAADEDAARAAILVANPHAHGQRVTIAAVQWGTPRAEMQR